MSNGVHNGAAIFLGQYVAPAENLSRSAGNLVFQSVGQSKDTGGSPSQQNYTKSTGVALWRFRGGQVREQACDFAFEAANVPEDTLMFLQNFIVHPVGSEIQLGDFVVQQVAAKIGMVPQLIHFEGNSSEVEINGGINLRVW